MPHEVESLSYVDNSKLARTGVPWHGIGQAHDDWLTDAQAKSAIGFEVGTQPLYRQNAAGLFVKLDDAQETVRLENDQHLGTVGSDYEVFGGEELIELGSVLVDDWGAKWDTAGVLRDGRIVFATLRLDVVSQEGRGLVALDDSDYFTWLLLQSSHDGSYGVSGNVVKIRTVCRNTFVAGLASAKSGWKVRHVGDVSQRAREAHRTIGLVTKRDAEFAEFAEKLAETAFELESYDKFAENLFPTKRATVSDDGVELGKIATRNATERQEAVKANWLNTKTVPDELRFTAWGLLNATTEWAEHLRTPRKSVHKENEARMLSTLFGGPTAQIRDRATRYLQRV